jgi:hypothetical protein
MNLNPPMVKFRVVSLLALLATATVAGAAENSNPPVRLPDVTVLGQMLPVTSEEQRIGAYDQPEWTQHRRFPTTRVFVQKQPGEFGFEQWWRGRFKRDGSQQHKLQSEVEIGLPKRFQLDLYENLVGDEHGRFNHLSRAVELRWALADWGKLPLNPTLYGEWQFANHRLQADTWEVKLLLGEELAPRWHWGLNLIYEQEAGHNRATEAAWSQGVSYTFIDQKLSGGLEMRFAHESEKGNRSQPEITYMLGPSLQWRMCPRTHLDLVNLFGITKDAPKVEAFLVFSVDLGGVKGSGRYAPASLKSQ